MASFPRTEAGGQGLSLTPYIIVYAGGMSNGEAGNLVENFSGRLGILCRAEIIGSPLYRSWALSV